MKATQAEIDAIRARARADIVPTFRYTLAVQYAREMGWLEVRDPFTGEWHAIRVEDAPPAWRRAAYAEKRRRKMGIEAA